MSMVPQGVRTHILQPTGISLQFVASGNLSATSVERGLHKTNTKIISATTSGRFPTNLDNTNTDQNDGASCRPLLPISGFSKTSPSLPFSDQYAFHPTGSTTAAIVSLLQTVTNLLQSNPFVVVISLDFSKAFNNVRHYSLLTKMAAPYTMVRCRPRGQYQPALSRDPASDQRHMPLQPPTLSRSTPATTSSSSQRTRTSSSRLSVPTRGPQNSTTFQRGRP